MDKAQDEARRTGVRAAAIALAVIASAAVAACQYPNCDHIVGDRCVESSSPGPGDTERCTSNGDCAAPSVCDVAGSQQCVQCTQDHAEACTGVTPLCGADRECHACKAHDDCALSNACLPDGSCATTSDVAYADPEGSDNSTCSQQAPCTSVAKVLATGRSYIKLHGTIDEAVAIAGGRTVTFLADPHTILTRSSGGPVLTVRDDVTSLKIYDLTITDVPDSRTYSIVVLPNGSPSLSLVRVTVANNTGGGISVGGGRFTIAQSTISSNSAGGIMIDGDTKFVVVGNVFVGNGNEGSAVGGLDISTFESPSNRLEFNTFYKNAVQDGIGAAINCVAGIFTARNNIMFGNGTLTNQEQVAGPCDHAYSIVRPGTLPAGDGNKAADPLFIDPVGRNLRLEPRSPAIGAADPAADLTGPAARDRDGSIRSKPATLGAYQVH